MIEAKKIYESVSRQSAPFIYDLGELWDRQTGLPFVYALWVIRKKSLSEKDELIKRLSSDLVKAKKYASENRRLIARDAPQRKWIGEEELVNYWKTISYDFTEKHVEGLNLFEKYVKKIRQ
jgi:chorismate dehydratase